MAAGASGEESAWHDLIANFAVEPDPAGGEPPWPERENLPVSSPAGPATGSGPAPGAGPDTDSGAETDSGPDTDPDLKLDLTDDTDPEFDFGGGPGAQSAGWSSQPRIIRPASPVPPTPPPAGSRPGASAPASAEGDFVPPVPPPLPTLDPVTKGAWAALFGGPAYLLIATMAGWVVPGWAAFLAVGAFVAGFATLVIRMGDRPPRDSGPDDGAVL